MNAAELAALTDVELMNYVNAPIFAPPYPEWFELSERRLAELQIWDPAMKCRHLFAAMTRYPNKLFIDRMIASLFLPESAMVNGSFLYHKVKILFTLRIREDGAEAG